MSKHTISVVEQDMLNKDEATIHSFLSESYQHAKKQLNEGVSFIHDGVSFLKEEFSAIYDKTGEYLNRMLLPVNNFLKDLTQIDTELQQEVSKESTQLFFLDGKMMPVDQVLSQPMEENY